LMRRILAVHSARRALLVRGQMVDAMGRKGGRVLVDFAA
jgi:hypothetical protein